MYTLGDPFPELDLAPGTNLLVAGPPMSGKRAFGLDTLARGNRQGDGAIIVTAKNSGESTLEEFLGRVSGDGGPVGVVDCVSRQQGGVPAETAHVSYASSPVDMTGIGIKLSDYLEEFYGARGVRQNRVLLNSLSTLLMYADLQTVFRFLHVFTGRVQSADALGLFVVDSTAHDDQTLNTLRQLFDGELEVRSGADGSEWRVTGFDGPTDWRTRE